MITQPVSMAFVAILLATLKMTSPATAETPHIAGVQARLLYERTGALSKNILPPAQFSGWNTLIGEGDAKEPANDLLVTVDVQAPGDETNSDVPLNVKVMGDGKAKGETKILVQRTFKSLFLSKGHAFRSILVPDAACAGTLVVDVVFGAQRKVAKVELRCGE